jgi:hypothetical protein
MFMDCINLVRALQLRLSPPILALQKGKTSLPSSGRRLSEAERKSTMPAGQGGLN